MRVSSEIEVMPFVKAECPYCFNYVEIEDVPILKVGDIDWLYCPVCDRTIQITIKEVKDE